LLGIENKVPFQQEGQGRRVSLKCSALSRKKLVVILFISPVKNVVLVSQVMRFFCDAMILLEFLVISGKIECVDSDSGDNLDKFS
jgi:hypothetical protein